MADEMKWLTQRDYESLGLGSAVSVRAQCLRGRDLSQAEVIGEYCPYRGLSVTTYYRLPDGTLFSRHRVSTLGRQRPYQRM